MKAIPHCALIARLLFPISPCLAQTPWPPTMTRVSVSSVGAQGNGDSHQSDISADGQFVAFTSSATNLVPNDTNNVSDVFVHDRLSNVTERVSVDSAGNQSNGASSGSAISDDGRYVAFECSATNLVAGDTNGVYDVFVHDRQTGLTQRVSMTSGGAQASGPSYSPTISGNGQLVVFHSDADDLTVVNSLGVRDVFVHNIVTGFTTLVSITWNGTLADGNSNNPDLSPDGRFIGFDSQATNLVAGDQNDVSDVFLVDLALGTILRISLGTGGIEGDDGSLMPSLSTNAAFVAFVSKASNLVSGDYNNFPDVFLRDTENGATIRISVDPMGNDPFDASWDPSITADGGLVAFWSWATNLVSVPISSPDPRNVYVRDWQAEVTSILSVGTHGGPASAGSYGPSTSGAGQFTAFTSYASNLVAGDTNGLFDIFVNDPTPTTAFAYCTAKTNSLGCIPVSNWSGIPSATASSGFVITASNVLNDKSGLLIYSIDGPAVVPFKGGTLCLQPPIRRTGTVLHSGGSAPPNNCQGGYTFDFNAFIAGGQNPALIGGQVVYTQIWSRDQGFLPPNNIGLTDAVAFLIQP